MINPIVLQFGNNVRITPQTSASNIKFLEAKANVVLHISGDGRSRWKFSDSSAPLKMIFTSLHV